MDYKEVVRVVTDIRHQFGKEILLNKTKFLSAFDDFAPKLHKERKILEFALDEQINHIFLDADKKEANKKEIAVKNAMSKLKDEAWFSEQAAHMIIDCFSAALDWNVPVNSFNAVQDNNSTKEELLYIKGQQAYLAKNYKEAVINYIMSASKGMALAQNGIGKCYEYGHGVIEDKSKACEWYLKAAEQNCADAQYNMGRCYYKSIGVTEDKIKAFYWHIKAANQGHAIAQIYVGYEYFNGNCIGQNKRKAFEWYLKAANQGYAYAQNEIGYCYFNGYGITVDKSKAFEWYLKSAEQDNHAAQFNAGWCYQYGIGVEKNTKQAKYWYKRALNNGNANAKEMLWGL
jgi:TPR repeat protein